MRSSPAQNEATGRSERSAFDQWMRSGLKQQYGHVTREPIPEQFLELLEGHAPKHRAEAVRPL